MSDEPLLEPLECLECGEESVVETREHTVSSSPNIESYEWACAACGAIYQECDRDLELLDVVPQWTADDPDNPDRT